MPLTYQFPQNRISNSDNIRSGNALPPNRAVLGVPMQNVVYDDLGTPIVGDADGVSASQTVTGAGTAFLINGALASGGAVTFDTPRNVVGAWTNTAIITITGTDLYGQAMTEVSASGTSHTGKKAFKTVTRVTTSATVTAATVGSGDVLGATYKVAPGGFIQGAFDNVKEATQGTFVKADVTSPATGATGDIRGTYDPNGTLDGTKRVVLIYAALNGPNDSDGFGVTQA